MKHLLYKEFHLSIHPFFYLFPLLLSLLFFLPNWIFLLVFAYYFWISVPQIFAAYNTQEDHSFTSMLPVTKKAMVESRIYTVLLMEGLHLLLGIVMGIIHVLLYGSEGFFLDVNLAFFGIVIVLYSLFNVIFLPIYYRTGYFFGKALILGSLVTLIYGFLVEFANFKVAFFHNIVEGSLINQLLFLTGSIIISVILNIITMKTSIKRFEAIS